MSDTLWPVAAAVRNLGLRGELINLATVTAEARRIVELDAAKVVAPAFGRPAARGFEARQARAVAHVLAKDRQHGPGESVAGRHPLPPSVPPSSPSGSAA